MNQHRRGDDSGVSSLQQKDSLSRLCASPSASSRRRVALIASLIFIVAFGARLMSLQDTVLEVGKVQSAVTEDYQRAGRLIRVGGLRSLLDPRAPASDPNLMGHPPGYPLVWAASYSLFGETDAPVQFFQMLCDAAAAVLVFLIAAALFPTAAAAIAGMLTALAPQLTWNSVLLLPDTLAVLPILSGVYLLVRAQDRPRLLTIVVAGMFFGLSCWLRANALLLAPFLCLFVPFLFERGRRLRYGAALVCGALVVIAPMTIRNAMVFGRFIPVSLGAGQTLLEGIADYDEEGRFGIPATDLGIMRQEAEAFNRPDYAEVLFGPDAVRRDRMRVSRALTVIRDNPIWFAGVMVRRAASMLRLERARLIEANPPVTHSLAKSVDAPPEWAGGPVELLRDGEILSNDVNASLSANGDALRLEGEGANYRDRFATPPVRVRGGVDYLFSLPLKLEEGRVVLKVMDESGRLYASTIVDVMEGRAAHEQPTRSIQLPFVSLGSDEVRLLVSHGSAASAPSVMQIGSVELHALGQASYLWTRWPRTLIQGAQRLFITAIMLPLMVTGLILIIRARRMQALVLLLAVPAYYLCVQSALHTEYRYVLAIHYCLFIIAAIALYRAGCMLRRAGGALSGRLSRTRAEREST